MIDQAPTTAAISVTPAQKVKGDPTQPPIIGTPTLTTTTEPFKSLGYKIHNEITYRGVDWVANSMVGVAFSYATARTEIGKRLFTRPFTKGFTAVLEPILKKPEWVESGANWGTRLVGILMGGTAIIPIMMHLENKENKKQFIHWVDEKKYGKNVVASDPRFKEQDARIDAEPKKDFNTGMITRFVALAPIIAATLYKPTNDVLDKVIYSPFGHVTKTASTELNLVSKNTIKKMMSKSEMEIVKGEKKLINNWDYLHQTIGFDFGLTLIYSFLHEISYKALAKKRQWHIDHTHGEKGFAVQPSETENKVTITSDSVATQSWQDKVNSEEDKSAHPANSNLASSSSHESKVKEDREQADNEHVRNI